MSQRRTTNGTWIKGAVLVTLIALIALCGCENATNLLVDALSPEAPVMEPMPVEETTMEDDTPEPDTQTVPVKLVWLVDYPVGGKEDYIAWVASVAHILLAPEETQTGSVYDNLDGSNPHRLVEFEFDSFADVMTYLNRPMSLRSLLRCRTIALRQVRMCSFSVVITQKTRLPRERLKPSTWSTIRLGVKRSIWNGLRRLRRCYRLLKR